MIFIDIDHAWNAMLLNIPRKRLECIQTLQDHYQLFLFSNTNAIHLEMANQKVMELTSRKLSSYFKKAYYSHVFGYRKSQVDAFKKLLKSSQLIPQETIFVDDSYQHIVGDREAGLHTIHLAKDADLVNLDF